MIIAVDTETQGLNTQKFVMGCIIKETTPKPEFYYTKQDMWSRILNLGQQEEKRKRKLYVYAHNQQYDFYTYANLEQKGLSIYSTRPFIAKYQNIEFLDSWGLFRMPLKQLGQIINLPKLETPQELINGEEGVKNRIFLHMIQPYIKRDTEIVLKAVKLLREKLKKEGLKYRKVVSYGQIGINYFFNYVEKQPYADQIIISNKFKQHRIVETVNKEEIHKAYRGGRVEVFKTGELTDLSQIDVNSMYPYIATKIKFPLLKSETRINEPLKQIGRKNLLSIIRNERIIGVINCMVKTPKNKNILPYLPIRREEEQVFTVKPDILIGTWTLHEIRKALELGYELKDAKYVIYYSTMEQNPLKEIMLKLYKLRKQNQNKFENFFYKMIMNSMIGKFAQKRGSEKYVIDDVEFVEHYRKKGYYPKTLLGTSYIYAKQQPIKYTPFYTPIIPAEITAEGRTMLYEIMQKIGKENLVYCDTDGVIFEDRGVSEKFKYDNYLGGVKLVNNKDFGRVFGKKTLIIGEEARISGVPKAMINKQGLLTGEINYKKMIGIKQASSPSEIGLFRNVTRDLEETRVKEEQNKREVEQEKIIIDVKEDPAYYINKINEMIA